MELQLEQDTEWTTWVENAVKQQCDQDIIVTKLLEKGFSIQSIRQFMYDKKIVQLSTLGPFRLFFTTPYMLIGDEPSQELAFPFLTQGHHYYCVSQVMSNDIQLYVIHDFLTNQECDYLMSFSGEGMELSLVAAPPNKFVYAMANYGGDGTKKIETRGSYVRDLSQINDNIINSIEVKMYLTLGISHNFTEPLQLQRYPTGTEFTAHTDYFKPESYGYEIYCRSKNRGNRTWTFMVYLNDVEEGGETFFSVIGKKIKPRKGMALVWNNRNIDGSLNPNTFHGSLPVTLGEKYIITKWFHTTFGS